MSLSYLEDTITALKRIVTRFPITIFWAILITSSCLMGNYTDDWNPVLVTAIMVSGLGLPVSLSGHIFSESVGTHKKWIIWAFIWMFLGANSIIWYGVLNHQSFNICSSVLYFGMYSLSIILVTVSPYFTRDFHNQRILTFNREVFTSYVFTGVLSTVLYIALSLAILVVNNLFNLEIDEKIYLYLMVVIAGILWTTLFLNTFPSNFNNESTSSFPAFRFIIQYIGIPVVIIYAFILVFYASANLFMEQEMEEWILWLILWFYILGFLIFCLNYSVKDSDETSWSGWFTKWYLWASIPISLLNIIGLWRAISDQGVSELTYILATFSLFLLLTSLYLLWSDKKDFRMVLGLLFALILVSTIGPLNMCKATINSQLSQFETILIDRDMLNAGQLSPNPGLPYHRTVDIRSKVDILEHRGSINLLKAWDGDGILGDTPYNLSEIYVFFGLAVADSIYDQRIYVEGDFNRSMDITGYEKMIPLKPLVSGRPDLGTRLYYTSTESHISLYIDGEEKDKFFLGDYFDVDNIQESNEWVFRSDDYEIKILVLSAELNVDLSIINISGIALFKTNNYEN